MRVLAVGLLALSTAALAQEDEGEGERRNARNFENEVVREVVRGYYLKADIGTTIYMNTYSVRREDNSPLLAGVMSLQLGLGSDFIDRERFSAAWEVQFGQGLFNGPLLDELLRLNNLVVEGDIHTLSGVATVEVSTYVTRRFSIGGRGGGGVMYAPLLMKEEFYLGPDGPVGTFGTPAKLHEGPLPMVVVGPTLEYYTKLSHFSIGVDVDVAYIIGFDLGISPYGYMKYTF
jgi:hypothetical protein